MIDNKYEEQSYQFNNIYDNQIKIFTICGTAWIDKFQYISKNLKKNHYIFPMDWGNTENTLHENPIELTKNCEYPENIIFMSNVPSSNQKRIDNGFNSILCNHNTFINTNIFDIKSEYHKKYNMVINSRAKDWKNIHLAREVDNTALIINRNVKATNFNIDTINQKIYVFGIAHGETEKQEIIKEAKQIVDVKEVVTSILMVKDLSRQKN